MSRAPSICSASETHAFWKFGQSIFLSDYCRSFFGIPGLAEDACASTPSPFSTSRVAWSISQSMVMPSKWARPTALLMCAWFFSASFRVKPIVLPQSSQKRPRSWTLELLWPHISHRHRKPRHFSRMSHKLTAGLCGPDRRTQLLTASPMASSSCLSQARPRFRVALALVCCPEYSLAFSFPLGAGPAHASSPL